MFNGMASRPPASVLNLRAGRLNRARLALLNALLQEFSLDGAAPAFTADRAQEIAAQQIPSNADLPRFFTAIRWLLGEGAEQHLHSVAYEG